MSDYLLQFINSNVIYINYLLALLKLLTYDGIYNRSYHTYNITVKNIICIFLLLLI